MNNLFFLSLLQTLCNLLSLTFSEQDLNLKPGLHKGHKGHKHVFSNMVFCFLKLFTYAVMMETIHVSQEMFAIDVLRALKPSLEHDRKHVVQLL